MNALNDTQYEQLVHRLLLTDDSLADALKELGLGELDVRATELELEKGGLGYCHKCGTWAYEVFDGACESCRFTEEYSL